MMDEMMHGHMMRGMGIAGLIGPVILVLVVAALIKYAFFR